MHLPLHTRALALVVALSTTAAIIVTVAQTGHPPPDGQGVIALLADVITIPQP
jgi:hypothetical protein